MRSYFLWVKMRERLLLQFRTYGQKTVCIRGTSLDARKHGAIDGYVWAIQIYHLHVGRRPRKPRAPTSVPSMANWDTGGETIIYARRMMGAVEGLARKDVIKGRERLSRGEKPNLSMVHFSRTGITSLRQTTSARMQSCCTPTLSLGNLQPLFRQPF